MEKARKQKRAIKKRKENHQLKFFFIVTFIWSWFFWLPLALAGVGIITVSPETMGKITLPVSIIAALGPAVGAFAAIRKEKGAAGPYFREFLSL